jgi:hypothetical protein
MCRQPARIEPRLSVDPAVVARVQPTARTRQSASDDAINSRSAAAWPRSSPTAPPPPSGQPEPAPGAPGGAPPTQPLSGHPSGGGPEFASSHAWLRGHPVPLKVGGCWNSSESSLQEAVSLPVQITTAETDSVCHPGTITRHGMSLNHRTRCQRRKGHTADADAGTAPRWRTAAGHSPHPGCRDRSVSPCPPASRSTPCDDVTVHPASSDGTSRSTQTPTLPSAWRRQGACRAGPCSSKGRPAPSRGAIGPWIRLWRRWHA